MAKKIRFPLAMADGVQVRTLDELKEHFDLEAVLEYGRRRANFGCSMDAEQSHLDEIKSVAMAFGFTPEEIDHLAAEGFSADELEEVLYGYGGEL